MLHETLRLDIIAVIEDEFLVLRRRCDLLAEFARAQRPIDQRHCHRLALGAPEGETIAARELRRRLGRAGELVDHLTLGPLDLADLDCEAEFLRDDLDRGETAADLAGERVVAAIAAL